MYVVSLGNTYGIIRDFVERYNSKKALAFRLKGNTIRLMEKLAFYYSKSIVKAQVYGDAIQQGTKLPPLRTNNVQLSKALLVSEKTIRNARKRLVAAGFITETRFRGRNASYDLSLNPMLLHIKEQGETGNQAYYFSPEAVEKGPDFFATKGKSLPHTVTSTLTRTKKRLLKLSGDCFQQPQQPQAFEEEKNVGNDVDKCGKLEKVVENKSTDSIQEPQLEPFKQDTLGADAENSTDKQETKPEPSKVAQKVRIGNLTMPAQAPATIEEALAGLPAKNQEMIGSILNRLWPSIESNLYPEKDGYWLNWEQIEKGKAVLCEYFRYVSPKYYNHVESEILGRVLLAARWINKTNSEKKPNEKKWNTPIPYIYFDVRRTKGFAVTKDWYAAHITKKNEFKDKELLTKAVKKYAYAFNHKEEVSLTEVYFSIQQTLGKRSKKLVKAFQEQIAAFVGA